MPLIHLYVPEGLVTAQAKRAIGERLAVALLDVERIPDSPAARAMSWIFWHDMPEDCWMVPGTEGAGPPRCLIEVVAPAGLLDAGQKEAAIQRLTQEVLGGWGAGDSIETRVRTWVVVREVPEGSWGVAGCVAPSAMILSGLRG